MIALILLPIFILLTYLLYKKCQSNIAANKPIFEGADLYLLVMFVIILITSVIGFI